MNAFVTLIGLLLLLLLVLACTALVLAAIILSLMAPEPEDRHERPSGQSSERGLRRGWQVPWQRDGKSVHDGPWLVRALHRTGPGRVHPRGRPR
jgi:hypothetical protein